MARGAPMTWSFPSTNGGQEYAFNHAGQESFKTTGIWNNAVREAIQNSLDANASGSKPVYVSIKTSTVPTSSIGASSLLPHIRATLKEARRLDVPDAVEMYEEAVSILEGDEVEILSITDWNTTGLRPKNFDRLVYREGATEKSGNGGGSFGIGKHAVFSISSLSTVCYSTMYDDGGKRELFIGKATLATHDDPGGKDRLQNVGFGTGGRRTSRGRAEPISGDMIPPEFRLKKPGTGVYAIGFEPHIRTWKAHGIRSVVCNFFEAIRSRRLIVAIEGVRIDSGSIDGLLSFNKDEANYRCYYDALISPDGEDLLEHDGARFTVKYVANKDHLPNRVAYVNGKGMFITDVKLQNKNPFAVRLGSYAKYAAVVQAADVKTDRMIRSMEPPSHNSIVADRVKSEEKREKYRRTLAEIRRKLEAVLNAAIGDGQTGNVISAIETLDFFPVRANGASKVGRDGTPVLKPVVARYRGRGMYGSVGGRRRGEGPVVKRPAGDRDGEKDGGGEDPALGRPLITGIRSARSGDRLRISFDNAAEADIEISIRAAGEEAQAPRIVPVSEALILSPEKHIRDAKAGGRIVIPPSTERMIMEFGIPPDSEYSGYELVERKTGGGAE